MTGRILVLLLVICCLPFFAQAEGAADSLYVKKVENLPVNIFIIFSRLAQIQLVSSNYFAQSDI